MTRSLVDHLPAAIRRWDETDPVMARLARIRPLKALPIARSSGFASLVTSLLHQQVSVAAGQSITRKLVAACGGRLTPKAVLSLGPARLRTAGLSRQKQSYVRDVARRAERGALNFRNLARRPDAEVVEELTKILGVGTWTAKMFLLFHLRRPDVVAPEDLGLRLAVARAYRTTPARAWRVLERQAAAWSPYGSLACLTLWNHKDAGPAT